MAHGRLADPDCTLGTDPRSDPRMVKALAEFGLDGILPEAPLSVDSPLEDRLAFAALNEEGIGAVLASFGQAVPDVEGVTTTTTPSRARTATTSRSTSAGPTRPAHCPRWCTCTAEAWRSAAPPTSGSRADANILLPQDLSWSGSSFATPAASSARIPIRPD